MIRVVIENVLLFLLPTAMYVGYVLIMRRERQSAMTVLDEAPLLWLFGAGAALVFAVLFAFSKNTGGQPGQIYDPPVYKDGKIQPGRSR